MVVRKVYKNRLLYIEDAMRIEYNRGQIYCIDNLSDEIIFQYGFEVPFLIRLLSKFYILERLLRCEPRYATRWSETEFLISHKRHLYKINLADKTGMSLFQYSAGTNNPLHFCKYIRNGKEELVFGDYGGHDDNGYVGVYRYTDSGLCEIASFPKEQIDHIHRVEYDAYRDMYWVFTGDTDKASGIWCIEYNTTKIIPYLTGSQIYRACMAFIEKNKIIFATDTPHEKNYIYSLNIFDKSLKKLYCLPGPCINGINVETNANSIYCFSTSVEPDSLLPKFIYVFTYKLGAGIADRFSYIIAGNEDEGFKTIWKAAKDMLPMCLFQFGNHRFPTQQVQNKVYFCPQSCRKAKGAFMYDLSINGEDKL